MTHIATAPAREEKNETIFIIHSFDNFWANKPASDGIGVQDHFAKAWQHVAQRYAHEPAVIGYDVFNEPFPGSGIIQDFQLNRRFQGAIADT